MWALAASISWHRRKSGVTMDRARRNAKIVKLLRARELTMDEIGDMFGLSRGAIALIAKAHDASPGIRRFDPQKVQGHPPDRSRHASIRMLLKL